MVRLTTSAVLLLAAVGCAPKPGYYGEALYDGPARPDSQLAIVRPVSPAYTYSIDGQPADSSRGGRYVEGFQVRLLPGPHTASTRYNDGQRYSNRAMDFGFVAIAGHFYEIHAEVSDMGSSWRRQRSGWRPTLFDVTANVPAHLYDSKSPAFTHGAAPNLPTYFGDHPTASPTPATPPTDKDKDGLPKFFTK